MSTKTQTAPATSVAPVADELARRLLAAFAARKAAAAARGLALVDVIEWGTTGPSRVQVQHTCGHTHDRAVQDLFQVTVCRECKKAADKQGRASKRSAKVAGLKARIQALEAQLAEGTK